MSSCGASYLHQNWSIPDSVIFYIAMNPISSNCYKKVATTCKYFPCKNPISFIFHAPYGDIIAWEVSFKNKLLKTADSKCRYWITRDFGWSSSDEHSLAVSVIPKIYRCDANRVSIRNQTISFGDFLFLAWSAESINFDQTTIKYRNGIVVLFEQIIEALPKLNRITFGFTHQSNITTSTFNELLKLSRFSTLHLMRLKNIPAAFDIESFYIYMKQKNQTLFELEFSDLISDAYKHRLEEIIHDISQPQAYNYTPPYIVFPGLDEEKRKKIWSTYSYENFYPGIRKMNERYLKHIL